LWAYVSDLNNLPSLNEVLKDSHLDVIISWRIASYHIPLMIMWLVLMRLTVIKKITSKTDQKS
jgi:glycosyltransferase 2 family protein